MKKTFKVVMLPTKKASDLIFDYFDQLCYKEKSLEKSEHKRHLYILSDEEIKEGDWYLRLIDNTITKANINSDHKHYECKKIVATTDKEIYFQPLEMKTWSDSSPYQIPESFIKAYIKAYNEGKPITEVDLEMKEHENPAFEYRGKPDGLYIKTRPDNTVIVHQSKMYSRDEVISLLNKCWYDSAALGGDDDDCISIDEWISQNL